MNDTYLARIRKLGLFGFLLITVSIPHQHTCEWRTYIVHVFENGSLHTQKERGGREEEDR